MTFLLFVMLRDFAKLESHAEKILAFAVEFIISVRRAVEPVPERFRARGRRLVMKAAFVKPEIDSVIADAVKYHAFRGDVPVLPIIEVSALELHRLPGLAESLTLKERRLAQGGQIL